MGEKRSILEARKFDSDNVLIAPREIFLAWLPTGFRLLSCDKGSAAATAAAAAAADASDTPCDPSLLEWQKRASRSYRPSFRFVGTPWLTDGSWLPIIRPAAPLFMRTFLTIWTKLPKSLVTSPTWLPCDVSLAVAPKIFLFSPSRETFRFSKTCSTEIASEMEWRLSDWSWLSRKTKKDARIF